MTPLYPWRPNSEGLSIAARLPGRVFAFTFRMMVVAVVCVCSHTPAVAQSDDTDGGEIAAFAGSTTGLGYHPTVGGSVGSEISRYALALFEGSYTALGSNTIQPWPATSSVSKSQLTTFAMAFHIGAPIRKRWYPYGIAGAALLWNHLRQNSFDLHGNPASFTWNQFNFGFETGGGVRIFLGENWGLRPEVKVLVTKRTFTQTTLGIFYVVPRNWP